EGNAPAERPDLKEVARSWGAVHLNEIVTVVAVHGIRAVAVVPDQQVGTRATVHVISARATDQRVITVAAGQCVVALIANQGHGDETAKPAGAGHDVVAAQAVDLEILGVDIEAEGAQVDTFEGDSSTVGRDREEVSLCRRTVDS